MANVINNWKVTCEHSPEMIDRIVMPIRKRGIGVKSLNYQQESSTKANCLLLFEAEEADSGRIFKNLQRITGIIEIEKLPN